MRQRIWMILGFLGMGWFVLGCHGHQPTLERSEKEMVSLRGDYDITERGAPKETYYDLWEETQTSPNFIRSDSIQQRSLSNAKFRIY